MQIRSLVGKRAKRGQTPFGLAGNDREIAFFRQVTEGSDPSVTGVQDASAAVNPLSITDAANAGPPQPMSDALAGIVIDGPAGLTKLMFVPNVPVVIQTSPGLV